MVKSAGQAILLFSVPTRHVVTNGEDWIVPIQDDQWVDVVFCLGTSLKFLVDVYFWLAVSWVRWMMKLGDAFDDGEGGSLIPLISSALVNHHWLEQFLSAQRLTKLTPPSWTWLHSFLSRTGHAQPRTDPLPQCRFCLARVNENGDGTGGRVPASEGN